MPGKVIVYQNTTLNNKTLSEHLKSEPIQLLINRDFIGHAEGSVYLDHGERISEIYLKEYAHYHFGMNGKSLTKWTKHANATTANFTLSNVLIANA